MVVFLTRSLADSTRPNTDRLTRYMPVAQCAIAATLHMKIKVNPPTDYAR
jgi:hypothetical protein